MSRTYSHWGYQRQCEMLDDVLPVRFDYLGREVVYAIHPKGFRGGTDRYLRKKRNRAERRAAKEMLQGDPDEVHSGWCVAKNAWVWRAD